MVSRGDVVWAGLNPVMGHEQAGHRPVLVVSDERFNERFEMCVVVPVTSRDKWREPLQIDLGRVSGKSAYALPGQVRSVSVRRLGTALGTVSPSLVERCLDAVLEICGRLPPRGSPANEGGAP